MNERYAVDPCSPSSARELKLVMDHFGLRTGRFVARYPFDWCRRVADHLGQLTEMDKKRSLELLQQHRRSILQFRRLSFDMAQPWSSNVAARREDFDEVIGQRGNDFGWLPLEDMLYDESHALRSGQGGHVPMTAVQYVQCALPLLLCSEEVTLVDRYFSLRDRARLPCRKRWPVAVALLRAAEESDTCRCVRLVLSKGHLDEMGVSKSGVETDLKEIRMEAGASRVRVDVSLHDDIEHGRYLFSVHGGLQFDSGFEERASGTNHVHWLSEPELEPVLERYSRQSRLSAPRAWSPTCPSQGPRPRETWT